MRENNGMLLTSLSRFVDAWPAASAVEAASTTGLSQIVSLAMDV